MAKKAPPESSGHMPSEAEPVAAAATFEQPQPQAEAINLPPTRFIFECSPDVMEKAPDVVQQLCDRLGCTHLGTTIVDGVARIELERP